ncbi:predicted protein [Histoplasma capsulatum var. duboisii H88]|uniref:Predicted protein n=1 Tax=Ajellomyces capsulatus (strain H88) TaxID=544711 RepID=F0UTU1_AJEC8|nr:predicted protein [Histoplasma capsulatum var. duboisii H88]
MLQSPKQRTKREILLNNLVESKLAEAILQQRVAEYSLCCRLVIDATFSSCGYLWSLRFGVREQGDTSFQVEKLRSYQKAKIPKPRQDVTRKFADAGAMNTG